MPKELTSLDISRMIKDSNIDELKVIIKRHGGKILRGNTIKLPTKLRNHEPEYLSCALNKLFCLFDYTTMYSDDE